MAGSRDECTEKTAFAVCWQTGESLEQLSDVPLIFENHHGPVKIDVQEALLHMRETLSDHDDRFGEMSYHKIDVFLVFFSYDSC